MTSNEIHDIVGNNVEKSELPNKMDANETGSDNDKTEETFDRELTELELTEIQDSFLMLDENGDGKISKEELQNAAYLLGLNPTEKDVEEMMREADLNGDGFIEFDEYVAMMKERYCEIDIDRERMITAFRVIDKNNDGLISIEELTAALLINKTPKVLDAKLLELLQEADINGDGMIDYVEFVTAKMCSKVFGQP